MASPLPPLGVFVQEYAEDTLGGDRTTAACGLAGRTAHGRIVTREAGVAAGTALIAALPAALDLDLRGEAARRDGDGVAPGTTVGILRGDAAALLMLERTLLNALQILCGVASETRRWVDALPANVRLLDTRKTHPGMRAWERLAVRAGGGDNHRFHLADAILLKDNHIALCGGVANAVARALAVCPPGARVQCEVESVEQADAAVAAGAHALLVDNVPAPRWPEFWARLPAGIALEFSGGVAFATLRDIPPPPRPIWISTSRTVLAARPLDVGLDIDA